MANRKCVLALAVCAVSLFLAAPVSSAQKAAEQKSTDSSRHLYLGPGSCSATACHGGIQPRNTTSVLQNEYSVWVIKDKHAQAYKTLLNPVSQRMGKTLGYKPETSQKCLVCHALSVGEGQKGRDFDLSEGVSCESCHGPSSAWLGPHTIKGSNSQQNVSLGMFDNKPIIKRAEKCMTCHIGSSAQSVDHEIYAAGHPIIVFELDSYSAVQPPHWKAPSDPVDGIRVWSVGQAVQLREALHRLVRSANSSVWPEYSELDCYACHHSLGKSEESWRQARGYPNHKPGNVPWNDAHYLVLRVIAREMDPGLSKKLEDDLSAVYSQTSKVSPDKKQVIEAANRTADLADRLAFQLSADSFDRAKAVRLMHAISADAESIANQGPLAGEQAAMALDSLFIAYAKGSTKSGGANAAPAAESSDIPKNFEPEVRAAINELFKQLENPAAYNGPRFAGQMKRVTASLHSN